jgi:hypothetical protein
MFQKLAVTALVLAAWSSHAVQASSPEGFLSSLSKHLEETSGHIRRGLASPPRNGNPFDVCDLVERHLGGDFIAGADGGCDCQGDLTETMSLTCDFENVCEDGICASIQVNATLAGIMEEGGGFGKDPKLSMDACVITDVDFLEEMCLSVEFSKPDFFLPTECSFAYGGKECDCKIDKAESCYSFDCSSVVLSPSLAKGMISHTCKSVDLSKGGSASMFLPALKDLPDEDPNTEEHTLEGDFVAQVASALEDKDGF